MSTTGVSGSPLRKARTIASVFLSVCPALSARCDDAWIAGPSAIGSVNGMPSSITSAPACGRALRIASEVSLSGSPAVRNVTSAARPWSFKVAKRVSMRVVMTGRAGLAKSLGRSLAALLAPGGEPDVHGAEHQDHDRADELHPILLVDHGPGAQNSYLGEPEDVSARRDDQDP